MTASKKSKPTPTPLPPSSRPVCLDCNGTRLGKTRVIKDTGNERILSNPLCPTCKGTGRP